MFRSSALHKPTMSGLHLPWVLPGEINQIADILQRFINQKILSPMSLFYLTAQMAVRSSLTRSRH